MVWWYASSLFPPHATAVDLCNRDRNPGIDDVPSGTAPYNVTRLAQNSCRLQPESRSIIGHNTRPSLPPQVLPLPPLAAPLPDSRLQPYLNEFSKAADSRQRISSDRICNQLGLFCPQAISPVRDQLYISSFAMAYATRFLRRKGYSYAMLSGSNFWQASALTDSKHGLKFISISNFQKVCRFRLVTLVCL